MRYHSWKYTTPKNSRRYFLSIFIGIISGIISGIFKLGWEVIFPPRTENRLTPPQVLFEKLGINVENMTYQFSEWTLNYGNLIIHFGFSIICAVIYCYIAEIWPKIKLCQGCAAGLVFWFGAHILIMPMIKLTPLAFDLPYDEQTSEIFGHIIWMWIIEIFRRDLRNRITHRLDPEFT